MPGAADALPGIAALFSAGFARVGFWQAGAEPPGSIALVGQAPVEPGVYAFFCSGDVLYVGSAQRGLQRRMRHYARSGSLPTAARIRGLILERLARGERVEVMIARPPAMAWAGLPVDPIAGLEEGLIRVLRPTWNIRGNRRP